MLVLLGAVPGTAGGQQLPGGFRLGGGVYLYHFQPLDVEGVENETEIYAVFVDLDRSLNFVLLLQF